MLLGEILRKHIRISHHLAAREREPMELTSGTRVCKIIKQRLDDFELPN
jgi:hypothetical protein